MAILHVLTGIGLVGLTVWALVCSLRARETPPEHWKVLSVFSGLLLCVILFTGFIQLGSRHSVSTFMLYKMGATVGGGILLELALVSWLKGYLGRPVLDLLLVLSIFLFGLSLYLGVTL